MAVRVIKAQLGDGSEVAVEVDEPDALGIQAVGLGGEAPGQIDFRGALQSVRTAAVEMVDVFRNLPVVPDACEISFGVKLGGSMGAIIAKATGEANFTVKLSWKNGD